MNKKTVIVNHSNPENQSWVEREFNRADMATGGIVKSDCLIDDCTHTLIIMNKTSAMGKSEQRLNSIGWHETKGTPREKIALRVMRAPIFN